MNLKPFLKLLVITTSLVFTLTAFAQSPQSSDRGKEVAAVKKYWNKTRIAEAIPRDFVIDNNGLAYMKGKQGQLTPYGHRVPFKPTPLAKGGGKPDRSGGGNNGGDTGGTTSESTNVSNAEWTQGGTVQNAAGRLFFVMGGSGYVCSGILINDGDKTSNRSIVLTAAHCVYDDVAKAFAEAAIFIPNQADTSGSGTDADCSNDPAGCWVADFGVVDWDWKTNTFPDNIPWDYAYYALGTNNPIEEYFSNEGQASALDKVFDPMKVSFEADAAEYGTNTRALGYSYKYDPRFMYCAMPLESNEYDGFLLPNCGLTGGASGGPWSQSTDPKIGNGPIISVNSYGPARGPNKYMGGPKLSGNNAACLFEAAKTAPADNTLGIIGC